ncbi:hypothetical protein CLOM_g14218 [Closterium sp. NIES-68]|nr:hypothetical protein CLOM_g17965 [Closterium sp. NIES-68]GJP50690.1 hypothetical protein CLOM_g9824 [Closterium sp. NIES-68]GJP55249.1 hypothetical protein CLOM_g14218 [Closterium sp. NIES-68]
MHLPHLPPPSLSSLVRLEGLYLKGCIQLKSLPEDIGHLPRLRELDLRDCEGLLALPGSITLLTGLKWLDIFGCSRLEKDSVPGRIGQATIYRS